MYHHVKGHVFFRRLALLFRDGNVGRLVYSLLQVSSNLFSAQLGSNTPPDKFEAATASENSFVVQRPSEGGSLGPPS